MSVRHLDCGTMRPPFVRGGLPCHVLLVERDEGLVLVDSGYGMHDIDRPVVRLGGNRTLMRPVLTAAQTAVHQVRDAGYHPRDVRDIVLTHLDPDHVGGIADFPWARVHVTAAERAAAADPQTAGERARYRPAQLAHHPSLVEHTPDGDAWWGLGAAQEVLPGVVLIALPGHSRGHAAVAVDAGGRWVLHVGDAFYHRSQVTEGGSTPWLLRTMERSMAIDRDRVEQNHQRIAELIARDEPGLLVVNAHDPEMLRDARRVDRGATL